MLINDAADLFRQGKALTNRALWANTTALAGVLSAFLLSAVHLARALGYNLGIDDATVTQLAGGIAAGALLVTNILHIAANPGAGLPPAGPPGDTRGTDAPGADPIGPG